MALEREMETYQRELPKLKASAGRFVLIREDNVAGLYDTYQDALAAGYEKFGLEPFLVKQVQAVEVAQLITRDLRLCPT